MKILKLFGIFLAVLGIVVGSLFVKSLLTNSESEGTERNGKTLADEAFPTDFSSNASNNQTDIEVEYNFMLARIKTLNFEFNEIADYKLFLSGPEAKEIDDKRNINTDKLSYHVKVAEEVYKAISSTNSTSETIRKAVSVYLHPSNKNLPQDIRAAICASYFGDYRDLNNKTQYTVSQKKRAVELAKTCNSYKDLYHIPDILFSNNKEEL